MPKELPKVDLEHPRDLDYIINAVRKYALDAGKERLRARGLHGAASSLEGTLEHAVERVRCQTDTVGLCRAHTAHAQRADQWHDIF